MQIVNNVIQSTFKRKTMLSLWTGHIILGIAYWVGLMEPESDAKAFVAGQIAMGIFGLCREYQIYLNKGKFTPSLWYRL